MDERDLDLGNDQYDAPPPAAVEAWILRDREERRRRMPPSFRFEFELETGSDGFPVAKKLRFSPTPMLPTTLCFPMKAQ